MFNSRIWAVIGLAAAMLTLVVIAAMPQAKAESWSGCGGGAAGSYNAGVVADTFGAEGPGLHLMALCDVQRGKIVIGARGEWGWRRFEWSGVDVDLDGWTALGRVGYLVTPGAMPYVLAGWTDLEASTPFGTVDADGAVVGAGAEFALGQGFFLQTEWQYAMLDPDVGFDIDANVHSGRAGLVYKWGWNPVDAPPFKDYVAPSSNRPLK